MCGNFEKGSYTIEQSKTKEGCPRRTLRLYNTVISILLEDFPELYLEGTGDGNLREINPEFLSFLLHEEGHSLSSILGHISVLAGPLHFGWNMSLDSRELHQKGVLLFNTLHSVQHAPSGPCTRFYTVSLENESQANAKQKMLRMRYCHMIT